MVIMQNIIKKPLDQACLFTAAILLQVALFLGILPAPAEALGFVEVMKLTVPFTGAADKKGTNTVMLVEDADPHSGDGFQYSVITAEKEPGYNLVLDCTLNGPKDMNTLGLLADRIYQENTGHSYQHVTINWRVGMNKGMVAPWARTSIIRTSPLFPAF